MADALLNTYKSTLGHSTVLPAQATLLAGGAPHQSWRINPFPVVFSRAEGAHKWDLAGRCYIDLWSGHGSLILGNAHPAVVTAIQEQVSHGTHLGGVHALHYAWAERLCTLVPSAEQVRFTASGSEGTLLALRIARSVTGRSRVVRLDGHFHGWHDEALAHACDQTDAGLNPGCCNYVTVVPPLEIEPVKAELEKGDVAALILEPGGGSAGCLPWSSKHLIDLQRACERYGTLLIFDEVISGFRYGSGGVQGLSGVIPDLTVLSKIASGGMPGGAVVGSADVMCALDTIYRPDGTCGAVPHTGTFNGFPLTAAAACTTLDLVKTGRILAQVEHATSKLVAGFNRTAEAAGIDVRAFNQSSIFHLVIGTVEDGVPTEPSPGMLVRVARYAYSHALLRAALLIEGLDAHATHGWLSTAHTPPVIDEAISRFEKAMVRLRGIPSLDAEVPL
ncbi:MAG: aminotransferase class III-fold pyridoxal phosphate-dependent enzyme [Cyanobacteria bacterium P01_G01_bin.38]